MTPILRPRRLRGSAAMRRLVTETRLHPADLVLPLFVKEGNTEPTPIAAMPGVVQHSLSTLRKAARSAVDAGVGGLMIFAVPLVKDGVGSGATDPDGILNVALREVADEVGDATVVMSDLCLDEFTDHGHCGVLSGDGRVDNDATLDRYAAMAIEHAEAGAELVGLSGMMDGQVGAVRAALDGAGHTEVGVLAYAVKYASGFYSPFREAVDSSLVGDRKTYQMDPANTIEADREVALDIAEGADIVMVKPALPYLDIVRQVAEQSTVPVAAYQVSGEFSMIEAAAARGWADRDQLIMETLLSIRRAGASLVLTYWAEEVARRLS
ncbi:MAG TPA: porphobilinogen synthase [Pseudonocardiaceae bacterium]|nr:porphobilinogen synthase [Pseudonocardiaceae bacterium]